MQPETELRVMRHADIDAGLRLCRLSQWNQVARDWTRFLDVTPEGATVAVRDGRIVGSAATIRYGSRFGWIGMVLVDPEARGQGLGTALLSKAIESLQDLPAIRLDATPAGHQIYVKRGFVEEYRLLRMQTVTGDERTRDTRAVSADVRPMIASDLSVVAARDEEVFGAPRADMLAWMHAGAPEYAWVAIRDGRLAGYMFGRHGFAFEQLGPIVAQDTCTAEGMVAACLSRHAGRPFVIDAAEHAPDWTHALAQLGFREQRPFIRMCRGERRAFGRPASQFAVLGPEFG